MTRAVVLIGRLDVAGPGLTPSQAARLRSDLEEMLADELSDCDLSGEIQMPTLDVELDAGPTGRAAARRLARAIRAGIAGGRRER